MAEYSKSLPSPMAAANPGGNEGSRMSQALGLWRRLSGDSRTVVAVALLAVLVAAVIVVILWTGSGQMVPLYGSQENYDTGSIVGVLEQEGIDFELDSRTGNVLVAKSQVANARMKLAAGGVTAKLPSGLESLENLSSISTSQFMESSRYTHAVEGELARTIMTLDAVRGARVHLAVPERTLFVGREEQVPTASVVLDLSGELAHDQVEAIVNMVAGSVPALNAANVSVINQRGQLLSAGIGDDSPGRVSTQQMEYTTRLEEKIAAAAGDMLAPMLGASNFRIRVSADVDFSQVEETRETLDEAPVLVGETSLIDNAAGQLALGIPGALTNQPPVAAPADGEDEDANASVNRREELNRRYETGRSVTHIQNAKARVRRLSLSVLVNDGVAPDGGWTDADLTKMSSVVQAAAGLDLERGDNLTLQSAPFVVPAVAEPTPPPSWWEQYLMREETVRYGLGGLLALLLLMFGVRPLVRYLTTPQSARSPLAAAGYSEPESDHSDGQNADQPEVRQAADASGQQPSAAITREELTDATLSLPPPGSQLDVQLEHLRLLADKETNRVAEVIKSWVQDDGRAAS